MELEALKANSLFSVNKEILVSGEDLVGWI